jgi:hypothetical protein
MQTGCNRTPKIGAESQFSSPADRQERRFNFPIAASGFRPAIAARRGRRRGRLAAGRRFRQRTGIRDADSHHEAAPCVQFFEEFSRRALRAPRAAGRFPAPNRWTDQFPLGSRTCTVFCHLAAVDSRGSHVRIEKPKRCVISIGSKATGASTNDRMRWIRVGTVHRLRLRPSMAGTKGCATQRSGVRAHPRQPIQVRAVSQCPRPVAASVLRLQHAAIRRPTHFRSIVLRATRFRDPRSPPGLASVLQWYSLTLPIRRCNRGVRRRYERIRFWGRSQGLCA